MLLDNIVSTYVNISMKVDSTYEIKCTLRCGMIPKLDKSIDDLLKEVDAALYEAQQTGRNKRVMHAARR